MSYHPSQRHAGQQITPCSSCHRISITSSETGMRFRKPLLFSIRTPRPHKWSPIAWPRQHSRAQSWNIPVTKARLSRTEDPRPIIPRIHEPPVCSLPAGGHGPRCLSWLPSTRPQGRQQGFFGTGISIGRISCVAPAHSHRGVVDGT